MHRIIAWLRATVTAVVVFSYVGLIGPFFLFHMWLTGNVMPLYRCAQFGCHLGMWLSGTRAVLEGRGNFPQGRRVIYMANHQSNVDPPMLFAVLPARIAFMAKRQLFDIPVFSTAMRMGDFVRVPREDPEQARASVEEALEKLKLVSFLVYPEGTRSRDGSLQKFKHGVFHLALRGQVPIVPLTVQAAEKVMQKGRWEIYPGTVRVTIHPAVEMRGRDIKARFEVADEVRKAIASALPPEKRGGA